METVQAVRRRGAWKIAALAVACAVFCTANLVNALHKGGDFEVFVESGRRLLARTPLYAESGAGFGVVGPPFQAVFFAPFALVSDLSLPLSRIAWYALGLAALLLGVALWSVALAEREPLRHRHRWSEVCSSAVLVPLLAVLLPVQTNFEHQNMNPLLLALLGVAAYCFRTERDAAAGVAIGAATALKAFPGLLILYFAYRRAWRALTAAVVTAAVLSAVPAFFYGSAGFVVQARQWVAFSAGGGWPTRGNNQSLIAMIQRLFGDVGPPLPSAVYVVAVLALLGVFLATEPTNHGADRRIAVVEMALVTIVAVIVSPIAWDHYSGAALSGIFCSSQFTSLSERLARPHVVLGRAGSDFGLLKDHGGTGWLRLRAKRFGLDAGGASVVRGAARGPARSGCTDTSIAGASRFRRVPVKPLLSLVDRGNNEGWDGPHERTVSGWPRCASDGHYAVSCCGPG